MQNEYLPLVVLLVLAALLCVGMISLSWLLGPKKVARFKQSAYECGVAPLGDATERFPIKFYLVGIIFVLFDIEVIVLWSWLTVFKSAPLDFQVFSFWGVMIYMALWIVGDAYVLKVGAIDCDESTVLTQDETPPLVASGGGA